MNIGIVKLSEDVQVPQKATTSSACYDLKASLRSLTVKDVSPENVKGEALRINVNGDNQVVLRAGYRMLVPVGIKFVIPHGYSVRLHPRSGNAWKTGITLANCEGVIDSDYPNETFALLFNTSDADYTIKDGDKVCQFELVKDIELEFFESSEDDLKTHIKDCDRTGGLGSTGK